VGVRVTSQLAKRKTPRRNEVFSKDVSVVDYFFGGVLAIEELDVLVLVAILDDFIIFDAALDAGEVIGTGLMTGDATTTGELTGLALFALLAPSLQAIPRAPKPRTVESKITFFICLQTPVFLKDYVNVITNHRPIEHGRFAPDSFLS
jgi:hypothetical protein